MWDPLSSKSRKRRQKKKYYNNPSFLKLVLFFSPRLFYSSYFMAFKECVFYPGAISSGITQNLFLKLFSDSISFSIAASEKFTIFVTNICYFGKTIVCFVREINYQSWTTKTDHNISPILSTIFRFLDCLRFIAKRFGKRVLV